MKDKVIQIGLLDKDLVVLTEKGRIFHYERKFSGTVGYDAPNWEEIELPSFLE